MNISAEAVEAAAKAHAEHGGDTLWEDRARAQAEALAEARAAASDANNLARSAGVGE